MSVLRPVRLLVFCGATEWGGAEIVLGHLLTTLSDRYEVRLLGVLPGTGGLTRVIDKRRVRKDRADVFATKSEGFGGKSALDSKRSEGERPVL